MLSEDSKWRIVRAYEKGEKVKEIAKCFGVNPSSVYDVLNQYKETGSVKIRTYLTVYLMIKKSARQNAMQSISTSTT